MALVTVARFVDPPSAHLARGLLEANGIEAFVFNEHYVGMDWLHSQAIGGVELRVDGERAAQARALLDDPPEAPILREDPEGPPSAETRSRCPACHAGDGMPDRLDHRLRALSLGIGIPLASGRDRLRCDVCGHRWRESPAHRGALLRVVDALVFFASIAAAILAWALSLPVSLARSVSGLGRASSLECWACGTPFRRGDRTCSACGVIHPPPIAFDRVIEPGRAYDATCPACHTPWLRADYTGPSSAWTCSVCHGPLVE